MSKAKHVAPEQERCILPSSTLNMDTTFGTQHRLPSSLKLAQATACLFENPSCVSTLRSISENLSDVRESDSVAKQYVAQGILDLLPSVIRQTSKKVVILGLEIMGALSLSSQTISQLVTKKEDVVRALIEKFTSPDVEVLTAACHTLEDVLVSPESLEVVKESLLLENLLRTLCLLADLSGKADVGLASERDSMLDESAAERIATPQVTLNIQHGETGSKRAFCKELQTLADVCIGIVASLLPSQKFKDAPRLEYLKALRILQQHWLFLVEENQRLVDGADPSTANWFKNSKSRHDVAKCLVLMGMEYDYFLSESEKSFGIAYVSTRDFREKFWERCPLLVPKAMPSCLVSFAKKYNTVEKLLYNLVSGFTTCPSASADQLDSLLYFCEVEHSLGDPLINGHDIKLVKTVTDIDGKKPNESEVHFFSAEPECVKNPYVHPKVMLKAIMAGFSLAIKGVELRCPDIARVADALAEQFGQPSVGVNMYVTPLHAQGLAVHFDDHCVLVCQLQGHKSWKIFPPVHLLPRLYGPRSLDEEALKNSTVEQVDLGEGDVLYIPRGYPHKAFCEGKIQEKSNEADSCCKGIRNPFVGSIGTSELEVAALSTSADPLSGQNKKQRINLSCSASAGGEFETPRHAVDNYTSVHLTFGVEVEPPFEWEGLVHVALRLWVQQRWGSLPVTDFEFHSGREKMCEALLHVAIKIVGDKDFRFRKACLIAAEPRLEETVGSRRDENASVKNIVSRCGALDPSSCNSCSLSFLSYFEGLITRVCERVNFSETLKVARSYLNNETDEVDIVGMEWLRHIPNTDKYFKDSGSSDPVYVLQHSNLETLACVKTFTMMKDEFGQALMFHDAYQVFKIILTHYRTMRKKSRNGMLALHGGLSSLQY